MDGTTHRPRRFVHRTLTIAFLWMLLAPGLFAQDAAVLLHRLSAGSRRAEEIAAALVGVFETRFAAAGGISAYRSGEAVLPSDLQASLSEPKAYLNAGRVDLITVRRQSGFDGLVLVGVETRRATGGSGEELSVPPEWMVTLHAVNFTVGEVFHAETLAAPFGAALLAQVEEVADAFARDLTEYAATLVSVRSQPVGAAVFLDNRRIGVTPLDRYRLEPGSYAVRLERQGYLPRETRISLNEGEKGLVEVSLYQVEAAAVVEDVNALAGEFHSLLIAANLGFQPYGAQSDWFFPDLELLYTAKWRGFGGSLGMDIGTQELERPLDTILGTRNETLGLNRFRVHIGGRYYPIGVRRRLDAHVGVAGGFSVLATTSFGNPPDYSESLVYAPYGRAELGVGFIVLDAIRLEVFGGYHYQGRVALYRKEPTSWGEPTFTTERFALHPIFAGLRLGYALYPSDYRRRGEGE